jgi:hypothetical protein
VLRKAIRQAGKTSFAEASGDLLALANLAISPSHLQRLTHRIGKEWAAARDADVLAFQNGRLNCAYAEPPQAAAVMVDGGRLQTREEGAGRGVTDPGWQEYKAACCQTLSSKAQAQDPQPQPPGKFLDRVEAARLAAQMKSRGRPAGARPPRGEATARPRKGKRKRRPPVKRVRTVVASTASSEVFGWQVAAEVQRRGLDRASRKGYICDGLKYNWTIFALHFAAWGFIPILDFLHLLSYLYWAAQAAQGKGSEAAWQQYQRWLRWAWGGEVGAVLAELRAAGERLGRPPEGCGEDDPRVVVWEAVGYVENNRGRMDYPRYRRLGLPVSSAGVESTIKQLNRRVKGTEKFWLDRGAEAVLQVRAAHLSEDDRTQRYWARPRPYPRAVGANRLRNQP